MTSTVRVEFHVQYVDCQLAPNEAHPSLTAFLSAHLKRDYDRDVAKLHLDRNKPEVRVAGAVQGHVSSRNGNALHPNTSLCFASYAWTPNDAGVECIADVGVGDVLLSELHAGYTKDVPLVMHTVGNTVKGTIRLTINRVDTGGMLVQAPLVGAEVAVAEDLKRYYAALSAQRARIGEAIDGTQNVDAPYNFSESGFNTAVGPVPLVGYMMHELPKVNTRVFVNAATLALARDGMRPADWHMLSEQGRQRATVEMLTLIPTYADYLGDVVQSKTGVAQPAEKFGARMGDAGDCEDFAEQIVQMHEAFVAHAVPQYTAEHAVLRDMQRIARQLISYTTLAIVNGQQVSQQAHIGAHMYALFEGWRNWKERLEMTPEGRKVSAELPYPPGVDTMDHWQLSMGEGTGIYENMGYATDLAPIMGAVNSLPSLATFKKPIWHPRNQAIPFYIGSVLGVTGYFARRGAPYGTWNMTNGAEGKRGVLIGDMISGNNRRFGMLMHPRLNKRILGAIQEAAAKREPVPSLVLGDDFVETAQQHPELERVKCTVASWGRSQGARHVAVPVYARPYQITSRVADAMIRDFQASRKVCKITTHLERVTNHIYGYRVMVHVNVE